MWLWKSKWLWTFKEFLSWVSFKDCGNLAVIDITHKFSLHEGGLRIFLLILYLFIVFADPEFLILWHLESWLLIMLNSSIEWSILYFHIQTLLGKWVGTTIPSSWQKEGLPGMLLWFSSLDAIFYFTSVKYSYFM